MKVRDIILAERSGHRPSTAFLAALEKYCIGRIYQDMDAETKQQIIHVFDAEMPVLGGKLTVYRGIGLDRLADLQGGADLTDRQYVQFPDYLSTSLFRPTAFAYSTYSRKPVRILFEITTMPGARGIVVQDYMQYFDWKSTEREVILNRNSKFKIIDTSITDNRAAKCEEWEIKLEQVK